MSEAIQSPFEFENPVIPPIFAGRSKEIAYMSNSLFVKKESIVIYGNDAIGKSSLLSTIYMKQVREDNPEMFAVSISAFDFIQAVDNNFLGMITHQICVEIWTRLLGRKYSELLENSSNKIGFPGSPEEVAIRRLFNLVTNEQHTETGKNSFELGGKFIIEGKGNKSIEYVNVRKPLAQFEFLQLLTELIDVIKIYGHQSILILCDELNHLPQHTNTEILRDYFNIFHAKGIQFALVIVSPEKTSSRYGRDLINSFNSKLGIGNFKYLNDVEDLVRNSINYSKKDLALDAGVCEFLFEKTQGHPWWIQKICNRTYQLVNNSGSKVMNMELIGQSFNEYEKEILFYEKQIKLNRPFRKHILQDLKQDE